MAITPKTMELIKDNLIRQMTQPEIGQSVEEAVHPTRQADLNFALVPKARFEAAKKAQKEMKLNEDQADQFRRTGMVDGL